MAEADIMPVDRGQAELAGEEEILIRVGDRLRAARERLGVSRGELSLRTKINERHLEALEDSDFAALPARIYAVGFARSYAGAVGLDAARIAAEVRRELNERENPPPRPPHQLHIDGPAKSPSNRIVWLSLVLVALLIVAGTMFWRSYFVPAVDLPPVREDVAAIVPELSPQAQISPTAESAVAVQIAAQAQHSPLPGARATVPTGPASSATASVLPAVTPLPATDPVGIAEPAID